jgi:hypothetical protein
MEQRGSLASPSIWFPGTALLGSWRLNEERSDSLRYYPGDWRYRHAVSVNLEWKSP